MRVIPASENWNIEHKLDSIAQDEGIVIFETEKIVKNKMKGNGKYGIQIKCIIWKDERIL